MAKTGKGALTREDILDQALEDIKGKFGDGAIMRLGDQTNVVVDVISTGILPLDVALGVGGLPRGRVVEVFGPEGIGENHPGRFMPIAETPEGREELPTFNRCRNNALDPRLAASLGRGCPVPLPGPAR
jgi:RecA/RadA recombinase